MNRFVIPGVVFLLLAGLVQPADAVGSLSVEVTGVGCDSRTVRPGDLFVALAGTATHGARFVADAVGRGAVAVVAIVFAAWSIDGYMEAVAPHWGQRELVIAYERLQAESPGRLVAFQLNWKGENFYRGNHLATFKVTGGKFQDFIDHCKKKGERTFYFITEHQRTASLQAELGRPRIFERLSDERLNNKFVLVRAVF